MFQSSDSRLDNGHFCCYPISFIQRRICEVCIKMLLIVDAIGVEKKYIPIAPVIVNKRYSKELADIVSFLSLNPSF